jgi:hypothetical protein
MGHSKAEKAETHKRIVAIAAKKFREEGLAGVESQNWEYWLIERSAAISRAAEWRRTVGASILRGKERSVSFRRRQRCPC